MLQQMLRWFMKHPWRNTVLLIFAGCLCYHLFGWTPRDGAAKVAYLNWRFPIEGETIVEVEPDGVTSGAGIRGRKRFVVVTDTGARWLYRADVIFKVLPGQIGPAYRITEVEKFLISDPLRLPNDNSGPT